MSKTLFTLHPHSIIDVITNSSSELFVKSSNSKKLVEDLIKEVYPDYLKEYYRLRRINELSCVEIDTYSGYILPYQLKTENDYNNLANKYNIENLYLKYDNLEYPSEYLYEIADIDETNKEDFINAIDPKKELLFLFSKYDNPNSIYQDKLEEIMTRYHLG